MRKLIPLKIKMLISKMIFFFQTYIFDLFYLSNNKNKDKIILLEIPTYSNLGDQAIAYAEKKFFEDRFPERIIYEVRGYYYNWYEKYLMKYTKKDDVFVLIGGGNFGNQYKEIENRRVRILEKFKSRLIVSFPQTVYYTKDSDGIIAIKKMQNAMGNNPHAVFFVREKTSYILFKKYFEKLAILVPDIVLYLEKNKEKKEAKQVLLCMRNDCEMNSNLKSEIEYLLKKRFDVVIEADTCVNYSIDLKNIDDILSEKWKEFQDSKLVITDRLHGMIFSLITATPCIVLPNYNHKIKSFYETWLKDITYIYYAESIEDVEKLIKDVDINKEYIYNKKVFEEYFDKIERTIREALDEYQE